MTKRYELIALLSERMSPEDVFAWQTKLRELITARGGTVTTITNMGRRAVSYRIRRKDSGYERAASVIVTECELPGNATGTLEGTLALEPNVLRLQLTHAKPRVARVNVAAPMTQPPQTYRDIATPVTAYEPIISPTPPTPPVPSEPLTSNELDKRLEEILESKEL